jgi:pimeloyl-ACP methyl ester carboxylesterase
MWKWLIRTGLVLISILVVAGIITVILFENWRSGIERDLIKNSKVVTTVKGPVEYGEIGKGPAVMVIHGTPGGYDDPLNALRLTHTEQNGFHYILPSRPGYLRTPLNIGVTPAEQADAFVALLDTLHIQKTAIIGISGGGPSALQFALRYPDRCYALILEAALVRNYSGPVPRLPKSAFAGYMRDLLIFLFKDMGIARYQKTDTGDPSITVLAQAAIRSVVPYKLRKAGIENDLIQETKLNDWPLNEITCPTLILQGTEDQSAPLADAEFAHGQIQGSELVKLQGQDHMMMILMHKQLDDTISAFLRKHI